MALGAGAGAIAMGLASKLFSSNKHGNNHGGGGGGGMGGMLGSLMGGGGKNQHHGGGGGGMMGGLSGLMGGGGGQHHGGGGGGGGMMGGLSGLMGGGGGGQHHGGGGGGGGMFGGGGGESNQREKSDARWEEFESSRARTDVFYPSFLLSLAGGGHHGGGGGHHGGGGGGEFDASPSFFFLAFVDFASRCFDADSLLSLPSTLGGHQGGGGGGGKSFFFASFRTEETESRKLRADRVEPLSALLSFSKQDGGRRLERIWSCIVGLVFSLFVCLVHWICWFVILVSSIHDSLLPRLSRRETREITSLLLRSFLPPAQFILSLNLDRLVLHHLTPLSIQLSLSIFQPSPSQLEPQCRLRSVLPTGLSFATWRPCDLFLSRLKPSPQHHSHPTYPHLYHPFLMPAGDVDMSVSFFCERTREKGKKQQG